MSNRTIKTAYGPAPETELATTYYPSGRDESGVEHFRSVSFMVSGGGLESAAGAIERGYEREAYLKEWQKKYGRRPPVSNQAPTSETLLDRYGPNGSRAKEIRDNAAVAQPEEQLPRKQQVLGSTPSGSTKHRTRETSISAYREMRSSGKITDQHLLILERFLAEPGARLSRQELTRPSPLGVDLPINVVCARVNELLKADPPILVEPTKKTCAVTGREVYALELSEMSI